MKSSIFAFLLVWMVVGTFKPPFFSELSIFFFGIICAVWCYDVKDKNYKKFIQHVRLLREGKLDKCKIYLIVKYAKNHCDGYLLHLRDKDSQTKDYKINVFLSFFGAVEPIRKLVEKKQQTMGQTIANFNSFQEELKYFSYRNEYGQILTPDQIKFLDGEKTFFQ